MGGRAPTRSGVRRLLLFLAAAAATLATLKVLGWLPEVLQKETLRPYPSIEEVLSRPGLRDVRVPSYHPQGISWPPARILAQTKPYPAVLLLYESAAGGGTSLAISQAASSRFPFRPVLKMVETREKVPYRLKGRDALLEVGLCGREQPCSRISWKEGETHIAVSMRSAPFELIRIAESMLP